MFQKQVMTTLSDRNPRETCDIEQFNQEYAKTSKN